MRNWRAGRKRMRSIDGGVMAWRGRAAKMVSGALVMALWCPLIQGAEVASWPAKTPLKGNGISLARGPGPDWRAVADFDMVSEQMIADGALERYKAVIMVWGNTTEKAVLDRIGDWVERGGVLFYPDRELSREGPLQTVEGDSTVYRGWKAGETGKGRAMLFAGQTEPFSAFAEYVRRVGKGEELAPRGAGRGDDAEAG